MSIFWSLQKYYLKLKKLQAFLRSIFTGHLKTYMALMSPLSSCQLLTVGNKEVNRSLNFSKHCCFQSSGIWHYTQWYINTNILKQLVLRGLQWWPKAITYNIFTSQKNDMFKKHSGGMSFNGTMFIPSLTKKKTPDNFKNWNGDKQTA
jgi:hypothetical protein